MRIGISTACLYPMELEKALSTLISMNFKLYEIFINTFSEFQPQYLKMIAGMLKESGSSVKSVHPFTSGFESFLLFTEYERRFQDGLEFYKQYFNAANQLGAVILVLHGQRDDKRSKTSEKLYFEHYAKLYELGKTFGVTVAQENVNLFRSDDPEFITRMRKYLKDCCAFVLDIKQAVRAGKNPFEMCDAMGERIVHVHLNDNDSKSDCLLPGFGCMNYKLLLEKLMSFGYAGDLILEVYRRSFHALSEISVSKQFIDKMVSHYT
ncbi:MAG TPA: sugar phosphate isomerase/epimerase [Caproiciproducens sp.]|nr:sugar phosphate isomerase/epimerase [Caproiciproducens sp.]